MSKVTAWSYSRLSQYEQCPMLFKAKFVTKSLATDDTPAMQRGKDIHDTLAKYVTRQIDALPDFTRKHARIAELVQEVRGFPHKVVEQQWGYNRNWEPSGWFGGDVWFRSILDVGAFYEDDTAEALDWKTGKKYGTNMDQMLSQAAAVFQRFKNVKHVSVRLVYVDSGEEEYGEVPRSDLEPIKSDFERRVEKMMADTVLAPRPNDKCRFCPLARSNAGPCQFG